MHLNSICIDPDDNNIILSLRSHSSIIKINRTSGETMWELGGKEDDFGLTDYLKPNFQHYARVKVNDDNTKTISIFDNSPTHLANARVIEYTINESTKSLVGHNEYVGPCMGSAQRMGDRYFIGWGWGTSIPVATEISVDGTKQHFNLIYLSDDVMSYRSQKFE